MNKAQSIRPENRNEAKKKKFRNNEFITVSFSYKKTLIQSCLIDRLAKVTCN